MNIPVPVAKCPNGQHRAPSESRKVAVLRSLAAIRTVVAFAVLLAVAAAWFAPPVSAQTSIGSAAVVQNDVKGVQGSAIRALATGGSVFSDDQVETGDDSLAQLVFLDRTTLTVAARSQAVLQDVYRPSSGYRQLVMNTVRGSFRVVSGAESPHQYEVQFPQGYLTVRGTAVDLNAESSRTVVNLVEGAIIVVPNATLLPHELNVPGQTLIVFNDGHTEGPMTREAAIDGLQLASSPFATLPIVSTANLLPLIPPPFGRHPTETESPASGAHPTATGPTIPPASASYPTATAPTIPPASGAHPTATGPTIPPASDSSAVTPAPSVTKPQVPSPPPPIKTRKSPQPRPTTVVSRPLPPPPPRAISPPSCRLGRKVC